MTGRPHLEPLSVLPRVLTPQVFCYRTSKIPMIITSSFPRMEPWTIVSKSQCFSRWLPLVSRCLRLIPWMTHLGQVMAPIVICSTTDSRWTCPSQLTASTGAREPIPSGVQQPALPACLNHPCSPNSKWRKYTYIQQDHSDTLTKITFTWHPRQCPRKPTWLQPSMRLIMPVICLSVVLEVSKHHYLETLPADSMVSETRLMVF